MRIAVIDDDEEFLNATSAILTKAGHNVAAFLDASQGLQAVQQGNFDVLVTDMLMPETDGVEVIRGLRENHPGLWIVAVSGGGHKFPAAQTLKISEAFGANRVLYKPFRKVELLMAIAPDGPR